MTITLCPSCNQILHSSSFPQTLCLSIMLPKLLKIAPGHSIKLCLAFPGESEKSDTVHLNEAFRARTAGTCPRGTHRLSSVCKAPSRGARSSCAAFSPRWARQSSTELSGFAGLNTGEVWRSKPVLAKAEEAKGAPL